MSKIKVLYLNTTTMVRRKQWLEHIFTGKIFFAGPLYWPLYDFNEDINDSEKWLIVSGTWTMDDDVTVVSPGGWTSCVIKK